MTDEPKQNATIGFSREILTLFDDYVHGHISRRGFLETGALYAGSVAAATSLLAALSPDFAHAQKVKPDDERITTSRVSILALEGCGLIEAYVAMPATQAKAAPVVLVIHENRGLNPHIEDIARRFALDGFIAVAPDALTKLGGYPGEEDKARTLFQQLDQARIREDFIAAAAYAQALPQGNGRLGAVGFCYGGGMVNFLATRMPGLRAGVAFYGAPAPIEDVPAIKAELLIHMAGNDARINAMWPPYEAALKAAGTHYKAFTYDGVEHGFNNDTTPRFNQAAAELAWRRTLALFRRTLT
ncbi:dienelactone hydrolase family protein [Sphingobium sp. AN641]|uniref:dienelactone hydrolase family protein n=1 Tax=Sphingobium sp. AN641 TaxID=3133443 RepID=UPI0030BD4DA3